MEISTNLPNLSLREPRLQLRKLRQRRLRYLPLVVLKQDLPQLPLLQWGRPTGGQTLLQMRFLIAFPHFESRVLAASNVGGSFGSVLSQTRGHGKPSFFL
jgi:hypothetical protein